MSVQIAKLYRAFCPLCQEVKDFEDKVEAVKWGTIHEARAKDNGTCSSGTAYTHTPDPIKSAMDLIGKLLR